MVDNRSMAPVAVAVPTEHPVRTGAADDPADQRRGDDQATHEWQQLQPGRRRGRARDDLHEQWQETDDAEHAEADHEPDPWWSVWSCRDQLGGQMATEQVVLDLAQGIVDCTGHRCGVVAAQPVVDRDTSATVTLSMP